MNRSTGIARWVFSFLWVCPIFGRAFTTIHPEEASATIYNDSFQKETVFSKGQSMTVGDFNGDGKEDVAVLMEVSSAVRSVEIFFGPFPSRDRYSTLPHETLSLEGPGLSIGLPSERMADLNKDGRDDLAVYRYDSVSKISRVQIVFGEPTPAGSSVAKSLDQAGGLTILGPPGAAFGKDVIVGDFDGNGTNDFAVVLTSVPSSVYFILGGAGLFSGTVDLSVLNPFVRLAVEGYVKNPVVGNFDGDCCDDLALGDGRDSEERVSIFFGQKPFPSPGGTALVPDVQIIGMYNDFAGLQQFIIPLAAGDMTGDHKDELLIEGLSSGSPHWLLAGSDLSSRRPLLRQEAGFPESIPFYPISFDSPSGLWKFAFVDFDGDGAADLFSFFLTGMGGLLTTGVRPGGISLDQLGTTTLGWVGDFTAAVSGDFNGDGVSDCAAYENFGSLYPPYGALRFIYGFRPLAHPAIAVLRGPGDGLRVSLSLSVEGFPTEMVFSGDVSAEVRDKWIPYETKPEIQLTPEGVTKKIAVRFRNAVGRESDTVSTTVSIQVASSKIVAETNRLRPGGRVTFDCHVHSAGTLRADLYGPGGDKIVELANRPVEQGIYQVQWNGQNASGNRVARGVYFVLIEMDGETTRKEILVE